MFLYIYMKCKKVYNVALYSKSIKTNISRINKKVNIMIISSLGRKEGNEIKMDTKEGIFHCFISLQKKSGATTVRTWYSHCQGPGFHPQLGEPRSCKPCGILGVAEKKIKPEANTAKQYWTKLDSKSFTGFIYALSLKHVRIQTGTLQYKKCGITTMHVITNNYVLLYKS